MQPYAGSANLPFSLDAFAVQVQVQAQARLVTSVLISGSLLPELVLVMPC